MSIYYLFKRICLLGVLLMLGGCLEPFSPPEVNQAKNYLVVDGFLNVGNQPSRIKLSRTQAANQAFAPQPELQAKMRVEGNLGTSFQFSEEGNGTYLLDQQLFNPNEEYRLKITLKDDSQYLSEYVSLNITPPIEKLRWEVAPLNNGIHILLSTRDPSNKTWFYRWQYEETWEYHAKYYSKQEIKNQQIVPREVSVYTCYKTEQPSHILLGATIKQSQDLLKDFPITFVSGSTNKLVIRYTILVTQYALTQKAFEYWTQLQKTTENTGGLFDSPPSQITGNIRCINRADEPVFGFFSATRPEQKRIFINAIDFRTSTDWVPNYRYPYCEPRKITSNELIDEYLKGGSDVITDDGIVTPLCGDCRAQGGVLQRPPFW
jgi:hypothetical protein